MRQVRLVQSGVQHWYKNVIATTDAMFCYCSTMAFHLLRVPDMTLVKMIVGHQRTISCVVWCPQDPNRFASCSVDGRICVWDLDTEEVTFEQTASGKISFSASFCVSYHKIESTF